MSVLSCLCVLNKVIPHAKTLIPSHEIDNQLSEQQLAFVGSGNGSLKLNEELQREQFSEVSAKGSLFFDAIDHTSEDYR